MGRQLLTLSLAPNLNKATHAGSYSQIGSESNKCTKSCDTCCYVTPVTPHTKQETQGEITANPDTSETLANNSVIKTMKPNIHEYH